MIAKMLAEGFTAPQIKKRMKVSESYVYAIKKQMEQKPFTPEELGVSEETLSEVAFAASQGRQQYREAVEADTNVDAILNERGSRYGNFLDHATITYRLKEVARDFAAEKGKHFAYDQCEALDMIFHKLGRILNGDPNYADSWIDIAGYAKLVADRLEGKVR
jgi:hypothetical protein